MTVTLLLNQLRVDGSCHPVYAYGLMANRFPFRRDQESLTNSRIASIQSFVLAIRKTLLSNPCHPIFRKPDGNFLATFLPSEQLQKKQKPDVKHRRKPRICWVCGLG